MNFCGYRANLLPIAAPHKNHEENRFTTFAITVEILVTIRRSIVHRVADREVKPH